jgi:beta-1,4-mannosyltransferase
MQDLLSNPVLTQIGFVVILFCLSWLLLPRRSPSESRLRSVAILVLGDIGRSPRMMYHAESFAKLQFETFFVGYGGKLFLANEDSHPL